MREESVFKSVLTKVVSIIENRELPEEAFFGEEALRCFATDLTQKGVSMLELTFTFPVSNQRCYDSAIFLSQEALTNNALKEAAKIRMMQSRLFGKCRLLAAKKDMEGLLQTLNQIADIDAFYTRRLMVGAKDLE